MAEFFQRYFPIPEDWTAWDILNSEIFVGIFILLVGYLINRQLKDVQHESMELSAVMETVARNMQEAGMPDVPGAEEAAAPAPMEQEETLTRSASTPKADSQLHNYRPEAQAVIDALKVKLEEIAANDPDGRYRRTFEKIRRYDYRQLVIALYERKRIDNVQFGLAITALTEWNYYIRGLAANKVVPRHIYELVYKVVWPFELKLDFVEERARP